MPESADRPGAARRWTPVALGILVVALFGVAAWWAIGPDSPSGGTDDSDACRTMEPAALGLEVVREVPHDPTAFTQGLVVDSCELWESTGQRGESELRQISPDTGEVITSVALDDELFGEGLAVDPAGGLTQLTWTSGIALRWDRDGPDLTGEFSYDGEGWGLAMLATDGEQREPAGEATGAGADYAMTDGTDRVQLRGAEDFSVQSEMVIRRDGGEVAPLNELEWDGSHLWANRWKSSEILRIDLDCGVVDGVVDATELVARAQEVAEGSGQVLGEGVDVLNGIAWLGPSGDDHFLFTGKRWPVMFEVEVLEPSP